MRIKKIKGWLLLSFILNVISLYPQEVITATGNNATGSGGIINYTVGQVIYLTNIGINGKISQGIQQPFEVSVVTEFKEFGGIAVDYSAFPNPTTGSLCLKIENYKAEELNYQIYDINGKLVEKIEIQNSETKVSMTNYNRGTYILKIFNNDNIIKAFKIIKN